MLRTGLADCPRFGDAGPIAYFGRLKESNEFITIEVDSASSPGRRNRRVLLGSTPKTL
jgi:hypothetical protein